MYHKTLRNQDYVSDFCSTRRWLPQTVASKPHNNPGKYSGIHYLKQCSFKLLKESSISQETDKCSGKYFDRNTKITVQEDNME